ncbi:hypothetical protein [Peribacillus muralis]
MQKNHDKHDKNRMFGERCLLEVSFMLGLLINDKEKMELEYLLKREMDEILSAFQDKRIDHIIKRAMNEKFNILFSLLKRVSTEEDCLVYMRVKSKLSKRNQ